MVPGGNAVEVGQEAGFVYLSKFPRTVEAGMREATTQGVRVRVGLGVIPQSIMSSGDTRSEILFAYRLALRQNDL
jgi:hypothetical protein